MELKILGSSSKGNCYILDNGKEALVIECGISFNEVQKAVNFDISRIKGAIVSHEHGDHAKYVENFIQARIPVYMSTGTLHEVVKKFRSPYLSPLMMDAQCKVAIGNFIVLPFAVQHDAREPFGFLIFHPECGKVLFATDTHYLRYTFQGLNNILIECNYRQDILDANVKSGKLPMALRERTIKSHCSYDTCKEALIANDLSKVNNIVLIHLSDGNSNEREFKQGILEATGKTIHIARSGMTIKNFNVSPF